MTENSSATRIHLIDPDSERLCALHAILTAEGHDVSGSTDSRTGLEYVSRPPHPQIVICYLQMPHSNGFMLLDRIKRGAPDTPVILMTPHFEGSSYEEAMRVGAADVIPTLAGEELLILAVERLLAGARVRS